MKTKHFILLSLLTVVFIISCGGEGNKKRGADYGIIKKELNLEGDKAKQFDEIITKYDKAREENRKSMGDKPDRVVLFSKMEELQKQQNEEVSKVLSSEEMQKYSDFVAKNTRKRPRYDDELLAKIKTNVELTDEQMQVVNAANDAFEKTFHEAHDVYHGNTDLAKEYWEKFDKQRKAAIEKSVSPEQYQKFLETVKEVQFKGRE